MNSKLVKNNAFASVGGVLLAVLGSLSAGPAVANDGGGVSEASAAISTVSVALAMVAAVAAASVGGLVLISLDASATGAVAVLESAADGSRYGVAVSADMLSHAASMVGHAAEAVVEASGTAFYVGTELLFFVPNELLLAHQYRTRIDQ